MNLCIGFFGFIRTNVPTTDEINLFLNNIMKNIKCKKVINIDIYIYSYNSDEFNENQIEDDLLILLKKNFINCTYINNVNIKILEYNICKFIKKMYENKLNFIVNNLITYRILSLIYSITELSKFINNSGIIYDHYILTRLDLFLKIESIGNFDTHNIKNTILLWRTIPYESDYDAEDRIIVTSYEGIIFLEKYYDSINIILNDIPQDHNFCHEFILGKYFKSLSNLKLLKQYDFIIPMSPFKDKKYDTNFIKKCMLLINSYEKS